MIAPFSRREKEAEGRMRDLQALEIPHPPLRGTLSRWERDACMRCCI
jgi:hypothetical protein